MYMYYMGLFVLNKPVKVCGFGFKSVSKSQTNAQFATITVTMAIAVTKLYCESYDLANTNVSY